MDVKATTKIFPTFLLATFIAVSLVKVVYAPTYGDWTVSPEWTIGPSWIVGGDDPPQYGATSLSSTVAGEQATFQCAWTDDYGLSSGLLSHNASGSWLNRTAMGLSGTSDTFSDSFTLPATIGTVVGYRFYAKDSNQWNGTNIFTLTTRATGGVARFSLTVTVVDFGPVYQAKVTIYDMRMAAVSSSLTDRQGRAEFSLQKGEYLVEATKGLLSGSHYVSLVKNTELTITLTSDWWSEWAKPLSPVVEEVGRVGGVAWGWVANNLLIFGFGFVGGLVVVYGSREDDELVVVVGGVLLVLAFVFVLVGML